MNNPIVTRINRSFAAIALLMVGVAVLSGGGAERGVAALVGAGLAMLNWQVLRWVLGRFMRATERQKAGLMLLVVAKMALLMGLVVVLMIRFELEALGFLLGLSVLFLGPVVGALWAQLSTDVVPEDGAQTPGAALASSEAPSATTSGLPGRDSTALAADEDL